MVEGGGQDFGVFFSSEEGQRDGNKRHHSSFIVAIGRRTGSGAGDGAGAERILGRRRASNGIDAATLPCKSARPAVAVAVAGAVAVAAQSACSSLLICASHCCVMASKRSRHAVISIFLFVSVLNPPLVSFPLPFLVFLSKLVDFFPFCSVF